MPTHLCAEPLPFNDGRDLEMFLSHDDGKGPRFGVQFLQEGDSLTYMVRFPNASFDLQLQYVRGLSTPGPKDISGVKELSEFPGFKFTLKKKKNSNHGMGAFDISQDSAAYLNKSIPSATNILWPVCARFDNLARSMHDVVMQKKGHSKKEKKVLTRKKNSFSLTSCMQMLKVIFWAIYIIRPSCETILTCC